jgi:hypothetical protein
MADDAKAYPPDGFGSVIAAHADWSVEAGKRWISVARHVEDGWLIEAPVLVGDVGTLVDRLRDAAGGGAVVLGVDFPLGLPRAYAGPAEDGFLGFLRGLSREADFFRVCSTLDEIRRERPFYPQRGVSGMTRASHAAALGFGSAAALSRACDRATGHRPAGAPLFWTLGANQSGKAALHAWGEFLLPALASRRPPLLWPFEGDLLSLVARGEVVIAETYPAEALVQLGLRRKGSKRRQADRAALAGAVLRVIASLDGRASEALETQIFGGFGADAAGEDRFDCLVGVLCVINVLAGNRPGTAPDDPWIRRWEGWVLGQSFDPGCFTSESI